MTRNFHHSLDHHYDHDYYLIITFITTIMADHHVHLCFTYDVTRNVDFATLRAEPLKPVVH